MAPGAGTVQQGQRFMALAFKPEARQACRRGRQPHWPEWRGDAGLHGVGMGVHRGSSRGVGVGGEVDGGSGGGGGGGRARAVIALRVMNFAAAHGSTFAFGYGMSSFGRPGGARWLGKTPRGLHTKPHTSAAAP